MTISPFGVTCMTISCRNGCRSTSSWAGTVHVPITTASFWGLFGKVNTADEQIGSKSGYIGTDGKSIAYYRGLEMYAKGYAP